MIILSHAHNSPQTISFNHSMSSYSLSGGYSGGQIDISTQSHHKTNQHSTLVTEEEDKMKIITISCATVIRHEKESKLRRKIASKYNIKDKTQ